MEQEKKDTKFLVATIFAVFGLALIFYVLSQQVGFELAAMPVLLAVIWILIVLTIMM